MSTSASRLGPAVVDALKGAGHMPNLDSAAEAKAKAQWTIIAQAILDEITNHADIVFHNGDITVPGTGLTCAVGPVSGIASANGGTVSGAIK